MISVNVERSLYTRYNSLLPRGVFFSDELNHFLEQRVFNLEQKNKNVQNKGPINVQEYRDIQIIKRVELGIGPKLDIFGSTQNLILFVQSISEPRLAWAVKRNAIMLVALADTKAKELRRENK